MDKAEFVQRSPAYYALAIAKVLRNTGNPCTEYFIRNQYPDEPNSFDPSDSPSLLDRYAIWEKAVSLLLIHKMITIKSDPFGPPILTASDSFASQWDALVANEELPFQNYVSSGESDLWLKSALHAVENYYVNLNVEQVDFENPDREWEPLPIDQAEPTTKKAIEELESVISEVRSDNGYNSKLPEERDYVLDGLRSTVEKLKSPAISAGSIRVAFERLNILARRFAGSVKEATIAGARAALVEFSKRNFDDLLSYLWRHMPWG